MIFPAAPGTQLIQRERGKKDATLVPVIGWYHVQGTLAFPICPMPHAGLTRGRAVITPDGLVTDPSYGIVCTDRDEWMALSSTAAYWEATGIVYNDAPPAPKTRTKPSIDDDAEREAAEQRSHGASEDAPTKRIPDRPRRERAPRVFKTNSWWKTRDPKLKRIVKIDGGIGVPHEDDPVWEKIGLVDFGGLKKQGWTVAEYGVAAATEDDEENLI